MKIHIVVGKSGNYEDRVTWPVKAFKDGDKAIDFITELRSWLQIEQQQFKADLQEFNKGLQNHEIASKHRAWVKANTTSKERAKTELDPEFKIGKESDIQTNSYSIKTVEFDDTGAG